MPEDKRELSRLTVNEAKYKAYIKYLESENNSLRERNEKLLYDYKELKTYNKFLYDILQSPPNERIGKDIMTEEELFSCM
jgi:predicted nuclease with TOPRIM domain